MDIDTFDAGIAARGFSGDVTSASKCHTPDESFYLLQTDGVVILTDHLHDEIGYWFLSEFEFEYLDKLMRTYARR